MGVGRRKRAAGRAAAIALGVLGLTAFAAGPAAAWSDLGHRAIAELAYGRLTPQAKAKVDGLIAASGASGESSCPVASLADAATYLSCVEDIGKYSAYRRLHYDAIPFCGPPPPKPQYCRKNQCASEALKQALGVLRDPQTPAAGQLLALEEVAHLVGDLHQPLNMIDNDDDHGERIRVSLPGSSEKRLNLHDAWDQTFVAVAVGSLSTGLPYLEPLARAGARNWSQGTVDDWALETHRTAVEVIYNRLPEPPQCNRNPKAPEILDRAYVSTATPLVREQLAKAGVRLALVLNDVLR